MGVLPVRRVADRGDLSTRTRAAIWRWDRLRQRAVWITATVLFALGSTAATAVMRVIAAAGPAASDLPLHAQLLLESRVTGAQVGYSIYYPLLALVSGWSDDPVHVVNSATVLLGVLIGLRVAMTYVAVVVSGVGWRPAAVLAVGLAVVLPLSVPGDLMYMGKFSPVVWHNSTTILAVPACLMLFLAAAEYLDRRRVPRWLHIVAPALVIGCAVAKPNYVLALMPAIAVTAVWWLVRAERPERPDLLRLLVARVAVLGVAAVVVLAGLFLTTFGGSGLTINDETVTLGISPMTVWNGLAEQPAWALIASALLPLVMTCAMPGSVRRAKAIGLVWVTFVVAVVQFALLAEVLSPSGTVLLHGNWMWGAHMSTFVLYVVVTGAFVGRWRSMNALRWVAAALGVLQVLLGVYFLVNLGEHWPATWIRLFAEPGW